MPSMAPSFMSPLWANDTSLLIGGLVGHSSAMLKEFWIYRRSLGAEDGYDAVDKRFADSDITGN